ncbi:MAG: XRE family transcriptional regulator [Candidatus Pelethousia sp.]|nr:XRE family transcriptional regulator [Candidatus Pelethousia sp.]
MIFPKVGNVNQVSKTARLLVDFIYSKIYSCHIRGNFKKRKIAKGLQAGRLELKLSVREVAEYWTREGKPVSQKTIYGWESDCSQPNADTLMLLYRLNRITNVLAAFGYDEPERKAGGMTPIEKKLVIEYRKQKKMQPAINKLQSLDVEG